MVVGGRMERKKVKVEFDHLSHVRTREQIVFSRVVQVYRPASHVPN
jgi:hypothetical protein